jgi:hypothetical protein
MSTLRYRRLSASGDYVFGRQAGQFHIDSAQAVAQAVRTRLLLEQGEWFLNVLEGTPYLQSILGRHTLATVDRALRARILQTPGVTGIVSYSSSLSAARVLTVEARIATRFGPARVLAPVGLGAPVGYLPATLGLYLAARGRVELSGSAVVRIAGGPLSVYGRALGVARAGILIRLAPTVPGVAQLLGSARLAVVAAGALVTAGAEGLGEGRGEVSAGWRQAPAGRGVLRLAGSSGAADLAWTPRATGALAARGAAPRALALSARADGAGAGSGSAQATIG